MTNIIKKTTLALALGATALTAAAPADAQRYGGRRHSDTTGIALLAGIAGLAIGAAVVSGNNDRYRDRGYNDARDYRYDVYVNGYRQQAYDNGYGYRDQRGYDRCHYESRWDGYARRTVSVQVCN